VLSREVEDLLEHRQDHLDLVLGGDPLDVGGELPRIARRGAVVKCPLRNFVWLPGEAA
jgi:hypothetical protein